MKETEKNAFEGISARFSRVIAEDKLPIVSGLIVGLISAGFAFTNKFLNEDELEYLFAKGATISSGRWALALTSFIFPDISMPWIYGVIALALLVAASCIILRLLEIKSPLFRALFPALVVSFPAQSLTYAYRFTCAPYALAVLLIALSAYITLCAKIKYRHIIGAFILAFALGIYQAYISLAAGLYVVYLIRELVAKDNDWKSVLRLGLKLLAELILALAIYFAINKLVMHFTHTAYNAYVDRSLKLDFMYGLDEAYRGFLTGEFPCSIYLVSSAAAWMLYQLLMLLVVIILGAYAVRCGDRGKRIMLFFLLLIFPLSINCLLLGSPYPHAVEYMSYTMIFALAVAAADGAAWLKKPVMKDAAVFLLALIMVVNVGFANKAYLKQRLVYEEAYGFYSEFVAQIKATPDYTGKETVILIGDMPEVICCKEINMEYISAIPDNFNSSYGRENYISEFIGSDISLIYANAKGLQRFEPDAYDVYTTMSVSYPAKGSIQKVESGGGGMDSRQAELSVSEI